MKTITTLCLATVLSLLSLNSSAQNTVPFTTTTSTTTSAANRISNFNGAITNGKVLLNWTVEANQEANQFEVEKSTNGTDFTMAALVFGTDKKSSDNYMFYEKAKNAATSYRVKIILNNGSIAYSPVITVTSATN